MTPVLKELSELEVELPAGCRPPLSVNLVEPIPDVHSQRSQRADGAYPKAEAAEQPRRVELPRLVPDVTTFEEGVHVKRLIDPQTEFRRTHEEGIAEGGAGSLGIGPTRVEAVGCDRKLVISAQLLSVLSAAKRERLRREERSRIAKQCASPRRQSGDDDHRLRAENVPAEPANGRVRPKLSRVPLKCRRSTQRSAVELSVERLQTTIRGERQSGARIVLCGKAQRRTVAVLAIGRDRPQKTIAGVVHLLAAI